MAGAALDGSGEGWGLSAPALWLHRLRLTWDAVNASWNEWILGYGPENQGRFMRWLGMDDPDWRQMMLTLVAVFIIIVAGISSLLMWRYRPPRGDDASRQYRRFVRKSGLKLRRGETPLDFAARLCAERAVPADAVAAITAAYLAVRYGPPRHGAQRHLKSLVDDFRPATAAPS